MQQKRVINLDQPLVSIITPCYNGASYLDRYFSSILNQTYPNLELIFVNDGSTDRTQEIAESYRPLLEQRGIRYIYRYQENAGQASALNRGLKLFTGEYLTWPDADDEMTSDCIEKKVAFLQNNLDLDMCICKISEVLETDPYSSMGILERIPPQGHDSLFEDLIFLKNVFYVPGGYMVRTSALDAAIPHRDIYAGRGGQNAQILLPIAYYGRIGYIDDILFKYYIRPISHSHSINTTEKTIEQLHNYEVILLETLYRISPEIYSQYRPKIQEKYSRQRFGNALDSRNPILVRKQYRELSALGFATTIDWLRYMKYSFPLFSLLR